MSLECQVIGGMLTVFMPFLKSKNLAYQHICPQGFQKRNQRSILARCRFTMLRLVQQLEQIASKTSRHLKYCIQNIPGLRTLQHCIFVEFAQRSNDLSMNVQGRKWSPVLFLCHLRPTPQHCILKAQILHPADRSWAQIRYLHDHVVKEVAISPFLKELSLPNNFIRSDTKITYQRL